MFGVLCGFLVISLFFSCNQKDKSNLKSVRISTSGCFKTCPILDVKLDDNVVYYNLIEFNDKKGVYKYELTLDEISNLDSLIKNISLSSLKNEYASNTPDVQIYNTSFLYKGVKKEVFFFENEAPKEYLNFINYLISLKDKAKVKVDTILRVKTRDKVKTEKIKSPPIPE